MDTTNTTSLTREQPRTVLNPTALYFGDNGHCLCGAHSGASTTYTGRDLTMQDLLAGKFKRRAVLVKKYCALLGIELSYFGGPYERQRG